MLVQKLDTTKNANTNFIYPQYERACISNIPNTILQHFHIKDTQPNLLAEKQSETDFEEASKVVVLVVDGFGFDQFINHHTKNPFLRSLTEAGEVSPLTSVFPSQTTNALTTLNTGLTPQQHGLLEYFIYLKNIGIINALQFKRIGAENRGLIEEGFDPSIMFSGKSIHQTLSREGIPTFTHIHTSNSSNVCSKMIFRGSTMVPSLKTSDTIVRLRKNLEETSGNGYFFVHLDTLDTISHQYGPGSHEYQAELEAITYLLQKELVEKLDSSTAKETLLLLTADHGAIETNPNRTVYLNLLPQAMMNLQRGSDGNPIMPTGGPRDLFLHVKEEKLQETKAWLMAKLGDKAQIVETQQAVEEGLFGVGAASEEFLERAGNLLILPCGGETVWFEQFTTTITFLGQHGGLCEEEMLVPFGVAKLRGLKKQ